MFVYVKRRIERIWVTKVKKVLRVDIINYR